MKHDADRLGVKLESLLGKLCYTRCTKQKQSCKVDELETLVTDLNDQLQYNRFRDSRMLCRAE